MATKPLKMEKIWPYLEEFDSPIFPETNIKNPDSRIRYKLSLELIPKFYKKMQNGIVITKRAYAKIAI